MPDTRTDTVPTAGQHEALTSTHHHTALPGTDHVTAVIDIGALLWLLIMAFAISWRESGDRLRRILSELDDNKWPGAGS